MAAADFLFFNGKMLREGSPVLSADNRSFRFGDGCFETIQVAGGRILLFPYHMERLFRSLELLRFDVPVHFDSAYLQEHILQLARKNGHNGRTRIRLTIFRGNGGLYDPENHYPNHVIQSWELPDQWEMNQNGLVTGIFPDARRSCDLYSPLKHNNYLPNAMAALWAKENRLNEAFLLNPYNRIADATIANVFVVKNGSVLTPALSEGAVNGVMRRYLLEQLHKEGIPVAEGQLTAEHLFDASEVFLTNAISGIRWVQQAGQSAYGNELSAFLFNKFIAGGL
ncbi:aminotransferase class IV [Sediminibacterium ginsengisoli]|uniref:branched-chain-amino-acid transaminase n=1 Tax=Sediminibacterium ginsengisoli TaxID=413434 RepID=A0A1T4MZZ2_9BACT|nr:aminotransferase class IV [Sediminibacterium ginsengisoli]SJZ72424.1 branched-chain amino acid aminotransferase [Sediminibacterium ginsengisoli]